MDLHISLTRSRQLSSDVYQQLKDAILDGRLRAGESLPATRELARALSVSRNTVLGAYQQLIAEGFLTGKVGAGTFVTEAPPPQPRRAPAGVGLRPRAIWRSIKIGGASRFAANYDFSVGAPDASLFPWDEWRRLVARQLHARRARKGYPAPEGELRLRAAIAHHVGLSRSVRASADDVMITAGAQQAIDLIGRALVEPGARVAIEEPGYTSAASAFQALGARLVPVRVDGQGLVVDALPADAKLVYVTPSHQLPLGMPMSLARRLALLEWSERHAAAIVEDDYDSEFRFEGRPLEPLQSLDRNGRVLYIGTFAKVLLPELRLGFIVAPASIMPTLRTVKNLVDSHTPIHTQLALAEFIEDGSFGRQLRRLGRVYGERREALASALERHLRGVLTPLPSLAGLHTSALFEDRRTDMDALMESARAASLALQPLNGYYRTRPRAGLALGYGQIPAPKIDDGIRALASCLAKLRAPPRSAGALTSLRRV